MAKNDPVELFVRRQHRTDSAWLVESGAEERWLPEQLITVLERHGEDMFTIEIPEWLAIDRGLV